jgi:hypothetical protein
MYKWQTASEVGYTVIGKDFGRAIPKSFKLDEVQKGRWSGFSLAPKAPVAITREMALPEAFDPRQARLNRLAAIVKAELTAHPPRPVFLPCEAPELLNYRGTLFLPHNPVKCS